MKNPLRHRYAVVGDNGHDVEVIRKYRFDRRAAEMRAELLNSFAMALRMRTRARVVRLP